MRERTLNPERTPTVISEKNRSRNSPETALFRPVPCVRRLGWSAPCETHTYAHVPASRERARVFVCLTESTGTEDPRVSRRSESGCPSPRVATARVACCIPVFSSTTTTFSCGSFFASRHI